MPNTSKRKSKNEKTLLGFICDIILRLFSATINSLTRRMQYLMVHLLHRQGLWSHQNHPDHNPAMFQISPSRGQFLFWKCCCLEHVLKASVMHRILVFLQLHLMDAL